jgi:sec-independent protein translocase protein TatA
MGLDDPVVLLLIVVAIIFLFGGSKIPGLARALGEARREFDRGFRGQPPGVTNNPSASGVQTPTSGDDPLISAAQREGIDTNGKTREQIASELSWKLNKK